MLAGIGRSWKWCLVVAVLVVGGLCVFDWTRWWVLDGTVQSRVIPTIGTPTVAQVVGFRERIRDEARALWISPATVEVAMHCEQHLSNGFALKEDQTKIFWFLVVTADCRGRHAKWEMRLDNGLPETDGEALEAAGVKVVRKRPDQIR